MFVALERATVRVSRYSVHLQCSAFLGRQEMREKVSSKGSLVGMIMKKQLRSTAIKDRDRVHCHTVTVSTVKDTPDKVGRPQIGRKAFTIRAVESVTSVFGVLASG